MRNYRNVAYLERKPKKPSTQKSNSENEKNGLKTEFSMAWYPPQPSSKCVTDSDVRGFPSTTGLWRKWIYTENNKNVGYHGEKSCIAILYLLGNLIQLPLPTLIVPAWSSRVLREFASWEICLHGENHWCRRFRKGVDGLWHNISILFCQSNQADLARILNVSENSCGWVTV